MCATMRGTAGEAPMVEPALRSLKRTFGGGSRFTCEFLGIVQARWHSWGSSSQQVHRTSESGSPRSHYRTRTVLFGSQKKENVT
jgi:hypothetical protein